MRGSTVGVAREIWVSARRADRFLKVRNAAQLTAEFRSLGLKVTPQRELVFRLLHDNTTHPTADALFGTRVRKCPGFRCAPPIKLSPSSRRWVNPSRLPLTVGPRGSTRTSPCTTIGCVSAVRRSSTSMSRASSNCTRKSSARRVWRACDREYRHRVARPVQPLRWRPGAFGSVLKQFPPNQPPPNQSPPNQSLYIDKE